MEDCTPGQPDTPAHDHDPVEPLELLGDLREETTAGFLDRLRATIHRRLLAAELVELSWRGVREVVVQYVWIVVQIFHRPSSREEESR